MSRLPPWRHGDLPHPPPFSSANLARVLGPGGLMLGLSIGAADWLLGPAVALTHGPGLLWLATASILLQALVNTEMARYTLATGESIFAGFMRTWPGPRFWGWVYAVSLLGQVAWPGWALGAGSALATLLLGHAPRADEWWLVRSLGYAVLSLSVVVVLLGRRVERHLVRWQLVTIGWALGFLLVAGVALVPGSVWQRAALGFLGPLGGPAPLPAGADWPLLAALAGYAGAGGLLNATFTQWIRDKGFGMAGTATAAPVTLGWQTLPLGDQGVLVSPGDENRAKWRRWWPYVQADLWGLFVVGSLIGMGLCVALALAAPPAGSDLAGPGAGAALARGVTERHGLGWGIPTLFTGFAILTMAQVGVTWGVVRSETDILVGAALLSPGTGDQAVGWIFHGALLGLALASALTMTLGDPVTLVVVSAVVAAAAFAMASLHTCWVTARLLPREVRSPVSSRLALLLASGFFGWLVLAALRRPAGLAPAAWW
jgi:hypothetical protein